MSVPATMSAQNSARWRAAINMLRPKQAQLIGGSVVMLVGSGVVSAVNFGYNVAVARLLGPAAFGHAAAGVTLLMLVSAITLAFQLVCAKFIARNETAGAKASVYRTLMRRAWYVGVALGSVLIFASGPVADYLHLPSATLVVLLAFGIAFYIPLGVKRGGLQGICSFGKLTLNFVLEALTRFLGAIVLIEIGQGVYGAVGAIALSVILAYFLPLTLRELDAPLESGLPAPFGEGMQAIVFFVGQVIINNIDILLVKHFFDSQVAGLYAAVALVGRVLYFFSWSVVSAMFPITAAARAEEESASVLVVPLTLVLGISITFTGGLILFPEFALRMIFGTGFQEAGQQLGPLLALYAAATGIYALAVVLMAYEMSRRLANTGLIQLLFSGAIIIGIAAFHSSLRDVVVVQLVAMVVLLATVSRPFFNAARLAVAGGGELTGPPVEVAPARVVVVDAATQVDAATLAEAAQGVKRVGRVSEAEVIAEFLKSEFHHPEFERDRDRFQKCVNNPDIRNHAENALRRALLFRRRETMWRELPHDTEWWEVQLTADDLKRIRVFPRAQWRKIAAGDFLLTNIVQRVHAGQVRNARASDFLNQLKAFSMELHERDDRSGILLIGLDAQQPLTIIEGNHRMTAAMLNSPELALNRFRYLCGFSPRMTECCWYQTNLTTLWRYAQNRLKILVYDREAELARLARHYTVLNSENSDAGTSQQPAVAGNQTLRRRAS